MPAALAQLRVDITRGTVQPMPIAISPLAGDAPADVQRGAADRGGRPATTSTARACSGPSTGSAYIQSPNELRTHRRASPTGGRSTPRRWSPARVQADGGRCAVEFRLWDVFAGNQLVGMRFEAADAKWRQVAHKIADEVYERMTGEGGYFDTRIAYVGETGPATRRVKRARRSWTRTAPTAASSPTARSLVLTPRIAPTAAGIAYMTYPQRPAARRIVRTSTAGPQGVLGDFPGMTFAPRFSPDGGRCSSPWRRAATPTSTPGT